MDDFGLFMADLRVIREFYADFWGCSGHRIRLLWAYHVAPFSWAGDSQMAGMHDYVTLEVSFQAISGTFIQRQSPELAQMHV